MMIFVDHLFWIPLDVHVALRQFSIVFSRVTSGCNFLDGVHVAIVSPIDVSSSVLESTTSWLSRFLCVG